MDIYKLKFTVLQQEIFRFLCLEAGRSFTGRQLAKKLRVSPTAIAKSLPLLRYEKLIVAEKDEESGRMSISFNSKNSRAVWMKRIENLNLVYSSGLVDFLSEKFPKSRIVLTGPYSNGLDTLESGISISVIGSTVRKVNLAKFEEILDRKIIVKFREKCPQGIILSGGENECC